MNFKNLYRNRFIVAVFLAALSFFPRALNPGLVPFGTGQDEHFLNVERIVRYGEWPLVGTTNSWLYIGPLEFYLFSFPQWLSSDPRVSVVFSAFLSAIAVLVFLAGLRRHLGELPSFLAALLFATMPSAISFSRDINSLCYEPLAAAIFLTGLLGMVEKEPRPFSLSLASLGLAIGLQSHLNFISLAPLLFLAVIFRFKYAIRPPVLFPALFIFLLLMSPYFIHEYRTDFADIRERFSARVSGGPVNRDYIDSVFSPERHFNGYYFNAREYISKSIFGNLIHFSDRLTNILIFLSLIFLLMRLLLAILLPSYRSSPTLIGDMFILGMFLFPFLLQLHTTRIQSANRYYCIFYPAYPAVLGVLVRSLLAFEFRKLKLSPALTVFLFFLISSLNIIKFELAVSFSSTGALWRDWMTLELKEKIIETAKKFTGYTGGELLARLHFLDVADQHGFTYLLNVKKNSTVELGRCDRHVLVAPENTIDSLEIAILEKETFGELSIVSFKSVIDYPGMKKIRFQNEGRRTSTEELPGWPLFDYGDSTGIIHFIFRLLEPSPATPRTLVLKCRSEIQKVSLDKRTLINKKGKLLFYHRETEATPHFFDVTGASTVEIILMRQDLFDKIDIFAFDRTS